MALPQTQMQPQDDRPWWGELRDKHGSQQTLNIYYKAFPEEQSYFEDIATKYGADSALDILLKSLEVPKPVPIPEEPKPTLVGRARELAGRAAKAVSEFGPEMPEKPTTTREAMALVGKGLYAQAEREKDLAKNMLAGYREHVTVPLTKLGVEQRKQIRRGIAAMRREMIYLPTVEEAKELIESRDWRQIKQLASQGRFPTAEELGVDYLADQVVTAREELKGAGFRGAMGVLGYAVHHPSASWLRRGEVPELVPTEWVAKHPRLSILPLSLVAPLEFVGEVATHPEQWPGMAARIGAAKVILPPAIGWFAKKYPKAATYDLLGPAKKYFRGKKITFADIRAFSDDMVDPIKHPNMTEDVRAVLKSLDKEGWQKLTAELRKAVRKGKPIKIYAPKGYAKAQASARAAATAPAEPPPSGEFQPPAIIGQPPPVIPTPTAAVPTEAPPPEAGVIPAGRPPEEMPLAPITPRVPAVTPKLRTVPVLPSKEELLGHIDAAISVAPDVKTVRDKKTGVVGYPEATPKVTFQIDGGAKVFNTKEALTKFRKQVAKAPQAIKIEGIAKRTRPKPVAATRKLMKPLITKGVPKGYFADGAMIVKGARPKGAKLDMTGREMREGAVADLMGQTTQAADLLYYSYQGPDEVVVAGKGADGSPTWETRLGDAAVSDRPIGLQEEQSYPMAVYRVGDDYYTYNQFRLNVIRGKYPHARYGIVTEGDTAGMLIAYDGDEPVAVLAATMPKGAELATRSEPPLVEQARQAGLLPLREGELPTPLPEKDMPSSSAPAYRNKAPEDINTEAAEVIADVKRTTAVLPTEELPPGEAGFVRIPGIDDFKDVSQRMRDGLAKLAEPQRDIVTDVYAAIDKNRCEYNKAGLLADWAKESIDAVPATVGEKELVTRWIDDPESYQPEYDLLPSEAKALADTLKQDFYELWQTANDLGVEVAWRENYMTHIWMDNRAKVLKTLYPAGGKLGKAFSFAKPRKIETISEGEALGLHPILDPAVLNSTYKLHLYRTIANRNLLQTLAQMVREDGMPLIMGKPRDPEKLRIWAEEYRTVNVPALSKYMYVGEAGDRGVLLAKTPARADPQVAKALNDAFDPYVTRNGWIRAYNMAKAQIKGIIVINPAIHGGNVFSDILDEMNFRLIRTVRNIRKGRQYYKNRDEIVVRAVEAGVELVTSHSTGIHLQQEIMRGSNALRGIFEPIGKPLRAVHKFTFDFVRDCQIAMFDYMTTRVAKENPTMSQDSVDRLVANATNTNLGTIPHTYMPKWLRVTGSILLWARNWTFSNIDMVVKVLSGGRLGLGMKALSREEQVEVAKIFLKHILKGIAGLITFANLMQMSRIGIENELKEQGVLSGDPEPMRSTFQNEPGHSLDIDTGFKDKTGRTIYITPWLFRYIRDYFGYARDIKNMEARTAYNKGEILLKQAIEQFANYSVWQRDAIAKPGAPTWDKIKARARYFVESITPSAFYAQRPGRVKTPIEWIVPWTGTWIRRGAPGGRFTDLLWEFRTKQGYKDSKVDMKIDEHLQKGEFLEANKLMDEQYGMAEARALYNADDKAGRRPNRGIAKINAVQNRKADRLTKMSAPLNFYWNTMSKKEKEKYVEYLMEHNYDLADLKAALDKEGIEFKFAGN